jgi:hypothetical protein
MLYSFWKIRVSARGVTLPWQLVAAQPPGPTYFDGSVAVAAGRGDGDAAVESLKIGTAMNESAETAAASNVERKMSGILASRRVVIQVSAGERRAAENFPRRRGVLVVCLYFGCCAKSTQPSRGPAGRLPLSRSGNKYRRRP